MQHTLLGVGIMLIATSMTNVGLVLQKKAVDALPPFDETPLGDSIRAVLRSPLWLVGWFLTTTAIILNMVALGLADISIIQPLNGFGLVVLALMSRWLLREQLTGLALIGMGTVITGVAMTGIAAPPSRIFNDSQEILASFTHPSALATLVCFVLAVGFLWFAAKRWLSITGILVALMAATCSVLGLTFAKGFFGLLNVVGFAATLTAYPSYILLALLLFFSVAALASLQLAFQKGRAVVVTPVFAAASVILPLITGRFVFSEELGAWVIAAPIVIVLGVIFLGQRPVQPSGEPNAVSQQ